MRLSSSYHYASNYLKSSSQLPVQYNAFQEQWGTVHARQARNVAVDTIIGTQSKHIQENTSSVHLKGNYDLKSDEYYCNNNNINNNNINNNNINNNNNNMEVHHAPTSSYYENSNPKPPKSDFLPLLFQKVRDTIRVNIYGRDTLLLSPTVPLVSQSSLTLPLHEETYTRNTPLKPKTKQLLKGSKYQPLPIDHPVFHLKEVKLPNKVPKRSLLSAAHPVFGKDVIKQKPYSELFKGPVYLSGFFVAIDANLSYGSRDKMNPNAQLTIRDKDGNFSRVRYQCLIESDQGVKIEAIVRCQVGWISPHAVFTQLPNVIYLGKGFDISVPFILHFTMVNILDEKSGCNTGSCLYFSGTPLFGLSCGFSRISKGRLVMAPTQDIDPSGKERAHFFGKHRLHYRQMVFVFLKILIWLSCIFLCLPYIDVPNRIRRKLDKVVECPVKKSWLFWTIGHPRTDDPEKNN